MEIIITLNSNSPFLTFCKIEKETEKAYLIKNEYGFSVWIPKSALKLRSDLPFNVYTFEMWFRKFQGGKAIDQAVKLFK